MKVDRELQEQYREAAKTDDQRRYETLQFLDSLEDVEVTDWEAGFIETALRRDYDTIWFSEKQRGIIDEMAEKYL